MMVLKNLVTLKNNNNNNNQKKQTKKKTTKKINLENLRRQVTILEEMKTWLFETIKNFVDKD